MRFFILFTILLVNSQFLVKAQVVTLDSNFKTDFRFGPDAQIMNVALQDDGKFLIGGRFQIRINIDSTVIWNLIRLNQNGSIDKKFIPNVMAGTSLLVTNYGKILSGGFKELYRLDSIGQMDTTFRAFNFKYSLSKIAIQNDYKIMVAGTNGGSDFLIRRLKMNGELDTSYKQITIKSDVIFGDMVVQSDNKLIFAYTNLKDLLIINRYTRQGKLDSNFKFNSLSTIMKLYGRLYSIKLQNDGKILVGGEYRSVLNPNLANIIRLNSDGSLDQSFQPIPEFYTTASSGGVTSIDIQKDNKIVIGGVFFNFGGLQHNILRFNRNGLIDKSFDSDNGFNNFISHVKVVNDDKIFITGEFTKFDTVNANGVALLKLNDIPLIKDSAILAVKLSPNPSSGTFNIKASQTIEKIIVFDVFGREVLILEPMLTDFEVKLPNLINGIYYLKVSSKKEGQTIKILKI